LFQFIEQWTFETCLIGTGWSPPSGDHLDGATFSAYIAGQSYHLTRIRCSGGDDNLFVWSSDGNMDPEEAMAPAMEGRYRLLRDGTTLYLLYDDGDGWIKIGQADVGSGDVMIYFGNVSVDAGQSFTTYFNNFKINSGLTTYAAPVFLPLIMRWFLLGEGDPQRVMTR
jgi:hypothetical protein